MKCDGIIPFRRESLSEIIRLLETDKACERGVIAIIYRDDGSASLRISGFEKPGDRFLVAGLLDWVKTDILNDL